MAMKHFAIGLVALVVVACTTTQTQQAGLSGCEIWNGVERQMIPRIKDMTEVEFAIYSGAFTELSGGEITSPAPPRTEKSGICRRENPPDQLAVVEAVAKAALNRIRPLVLKYTSVRY